MVTLGVAQAGLELTGLAVGALEVKPLPEEQEVEVLAAQEFLLLALLLAAAEQEVLEVRRVTQVMQVTPAAQRPQPQLITAFLLLADQVTQ